MANKASASNKNNIIIHNVVNAETKKRKQRRRQYQTMQAPQQLIQMPPQILQQSGVDPDLVQAVRDSVSSQAAMLNEFRDRQQREQDMLAAGIAGITSGIGDKNKRSWSRAQNPFSQRAEDAGIPVSGEGSDYYADEEPEYFGGNSNRPAAFAQAEAMPQFAQAEAMPTGSRGKPVDPKRRQAGLKAAANRKQRERAAEEQARQEGFMAREELNKRTQGTRTWFEKEGEGENSRFF